MVKNNIDLVLASKSPRRASLLSQVGLSFKLFPVEIKEVIHANESPQKGIKRLALEKVTAAKLSLKIKWDLIIAADTVVCIDGKTLGKPENDKNASRMLNLLSGKTHTVSTGLALLKNGWEKPIVACENTRVTFCKLSDIDISSYVATGEPLDKAGGYAIQGKGAFFVSKISGCYYNVVGLPLYRLKLLLQKAGYRYVI